VRWGSNPGASQTTGDRVLSADWSSCTRWVYHVGADSLGLAVPKQVPLL
jgi:hypothetical protein